MSNLFENINPRYVVLMENILNQLFLILFIIIIIIIIIIIFTSLPLFYSETLRAWMKIGARIETPTNSINHILNLPIIYPPLVNPLPGGATFTARLWAGGTHFIKQLLNFNTSKRLPAKDIHLVPSRIRPLFCSSFSTGYLSPAPHHIIFLPGTLQSRRSFSTCLTTRRSSHPPPFSPSCVFVDKDTEVSSLSSKSRYLLFNQNINDNSSPTLTPWHDRGYFPSSLHIPWRAIYQPPTSKKEGDVQYKLLHNVLPSLPVLHHLNSNISSDCGWCGERGTITHLFITCPSIQPALNLLYSLISRLLPNL